MDKEEIYARLNKAYFSDAPHEQQVLDRLPALIRGATLFVDVGASLGQYTRAASRALSGATIWSIEADPVRYARLRENCAAWQSESGNRLVARHAALAESPGRITFHVTNSDVSGRLQPAETDQKGGRPDWQAIEVEALRLEPGLFGRYPDYVKMDVEGAELAVLRGAREILERGKTDFQIELHPWGEPAEVLRLMRSHGYHAMPFYSEWYFTTSRRRAARAAWLARGDIALRAAGKGKRLVKRLVGRG